ncbi:hypothetical protein SAY86_028297 [Trapa natans]|uniref:Uncharacterized protein n=1 Tax=Trapa natans TaxID=22666 RepID=A0AAN7LZ26_TRANT|nr:hypothetical protein SAY86_028297 [Trapa natans]
MYASVEIKWNSDKSSGWVMADSDVGGGGDDDVEDDAENQNPKTWTIVRIKFLKIEMVRAALTKIMHSIPSDGAGRLERPITSEDEQLQGVFWMLDLFHLGKTSSKSRISRPDRSSEA